VTMQVGSRKILTERRKLGAVIGDHAKTGINTRLNTGTYLGYSAMVADSTPLPHFVPSFSFWTEGKRETYRMEKAKEVARIFCEMKGMKWTEGDDGVMEYAKSVAAEVEKI
jgi:UDP-N-acetylglucosamine diphosphorylase / glucose-1-phosphate thymidylyltransferase / UDP-N-acetylgalactosamine diphosphorylase / glucosamine-1-phosphate N-acetyltransferase / galactosamine-1-phosphate N-acetyltransferase